MKQLLLLLIGVAAQTCQLARSQVMTGVKYDNGYTIIYESRSTGAGRTISYYGLKEEKTGNIILPVSYLAITYSGQDKLFVTENSVNRMSLYNAATRQPVTEPDYKSISFFSEGLAVVSRDSSYTVKLYGAINASGKLVIPVEYRSLGQCGEGLMAFSKGGNVGFINIKNEVVIPPTYQYAGVFSNGLAFVKLSTDTLYGYINKKNEWAIKPAFQQAQKFTQGYATVTQKNGLYNRNMYGVVNTKGVMVVPARYDYITTRNAGGTFVYTKNSKYGIVDSTGKEFTSFLATRYPTYTKDNIIFSNDTASGVLTLKGQWLVKPEKQFINASRDGFFHVKKGVNNTIVNPKGQVIFPSFLANKVIMGKKRVILVHANEVEVFDYNKKLLQTIAQPNIQDAYTTLHLAEDSIKISYNKSIALYNLVNDKTIPLDLDEMYNFTDDGTFIGKKNGYYDYYDYTGKRLSSKNYYTLSQFSGGLAIVQASMYDTEASLVDKQFNVIKKSASFKNLKGLYSEGLARVQVAGTANLAFINKKGIEVFQVPAADAGDCTEGIIWIKNNAGRYMFIDTGGKAINQQYYEETRNFSDGLACVKTGGKWGVINKSGEMIIPAQYTNISSFSQGICMVAKGNDFYLINKKGERVDNNTYTEAGAPQNGYAQVKKGDKMGIIDYSGKVIIPLEYTYIYLPSEGLSWVEKEKKIGAVDLQNKTVIAFRYDNVQPFKDGYAHVASDKKWGVVNKAGKLLLPFEFESLSNVYKNMMLGVKAAGSRVYALK